MPVNLNPAMPAEPMQRVHSEPPERRNGLNPNAACPMRPRLGTQFQTLAVALLAAGGRSLQTHAQTPAQLAIQTYAGLTSKVMFGTHKV